MSIEDNRIQLKISQCKQQRLRLQADLLQLNIDRIARRRDERDSIRCLAVETVRDVAQFFGLTEMTVRASWIPNGMPGKPGRWPLSLIARWRIALPNSFHAAKPPHSQPAA